jgi:sulfide:quinone oxidoreductase
MLIESHLRRRQVRARVEIVLYTAESGPMATAGPAAVQAVRQMVEAKGIAYHPDHALDRADPQARRLVFKNGAEADYDLLAYVPPHRVPRVVVEAGLADPSGWVAVDRHTLETTFAGVYAIGDVTGIPLSIGKPLPKAGVFAHGQAAVVAANVAARIRGEEPKARFTGFGECFIEAGDRRAGYGKGNFYAEPAPDVRMYGPSWPRHLTKVAFEKIWLRRWF